MDKELLRERKAGYEYIRRLDLEEHQRASFADRLRDIDILVSFARELRLRSRFDDSEEIRARWQLIREHYGRVD